MIEGMGEARGAGTVEGRRVHLALSVQSLKPIVWKPAMLKAIGKRRRLVDLWISEGKFPKPDGVKFAHPWWYVATIEDWLRS